ncbi:MAG TPA: ion channel [Methylomirabilota bacterium]|nr:ion channel [Methylomirabilota bacterium]
MQAQGIALLVPLTVSVGAVLCTIVIHGLVVLAVVQFVLREERRANAGVAFWSDVVIVGLVTCLALAAHLMEIAVWALLFMGCGEFRDFATAYYHSAVNYTTLGYGDLIMSAAWRMLGPLEAANGMVMFGVTTALVFGVIQRLLQRRFPNLEE